MYCCHCCWISFPIKTYLIWIELKQLVFILPFSAQKELRNSILGVDWKRDPLKLLLYVNGNAAQTPQRARINSLLFDYAPLPLVVSSYYIFIHTFLYCIYFVYLLLLETDIFLGTKLLFNNNRTSHRGVGWGFHIVRFHLHSILFF